MTIQTINDVLFPPFLFTTLFCLASVFLHKPEAAQEELTDNRTPVNVATVATPSGDNDSEVNGATSGGDNEAKVIAG